MTLLLQIDAQRRESLVLRLFLHNCMQTSTSSDTALPKPHTSNAEPDYMAETFSDAP